MTPRALALLFAVAAIGCSTPMTPTTVTLPDPPRVLGYDINVPDPVLTQQLQQDYPNGVTLAPMTAQRTWDFTAAYGGTPNVYGGEGVACPDPYINVGIVFAPPRIAGADTFRGADWPGRGLDPSALYQWVGRFVYAIVPPPWFYEPKVCR